MYCLWLYDTHWKSCVQKGEAALGNGKQIPVPPASSGSTEQQRHLQRAHWAESVVASFLTDRIGGCKHRAIPALVTRVKSADFSSFPPRGEMVFHIDCFFSRHVFMRVAVSRCFLALCFGRI